MAIGVNALGYSGPVRRGLERVVAALMFMALMTVATAAQADKTTARNLFFEAKDAYAAGDYAKAADLFRRSHALYPAPTAHLGLARALREDGKLVEAFEAYTAIVNEGPGDTGSDAFEKAVAKAKEERAAVKPRLSALIITVQCDACKPRVTLDGQPLPAAALGVERFVNPGTHDIVATAANHSENKMVVEAPEGETQRVNLVVEPAEGSAPVPTPTPEPEPEVELPPKQPSVGDGKGMRTAGLILGGLGLVSLVVAGVTGGLYLAAKSDADDACPGGVCATEEQRDAAQQGHTMGLVNTITLPVGATALGVGILLYALAPSGGDDITLLPTVHPEHAGLTLRGSF